MSIVDKSLRHSRSGAGRGVEAFTLVEMLVVLSHRCGAHGNSLSGDSSRPRSRPDDSLQEQPAADWPRSCPARGQTRQFLLGAFDWNYEGSVTEIGWVADMVNAGIPVGDMLCPSNPCQISATYNDLLTADPKTLQTYTNADGSPQGPAYGSQPSYLPDGTTVYNPCRQIATGTYATSGTATMTRQQVVQTLIYNKHYNTNYTASWWLVRAGVVLDSNGNMAGSPPSTLSRVSTIGPLTRAKADASTVSSSYLPLMACGNPPPPAPATPPIQSFPPPATLPAIAAVLAQSVGTVPANSPVSLSFTFGPLQNPSMQPVPSFGGGTSRNGSTGWWAVWNATLQDYRGFAPIHRSGCNILMADSSVQTFFDTNGDHYLNNGFTPNAASNQFMDATVELPPDELYSRWSLQPQSAAQPSGQSQETTRCGLLADSRSSS